MNMFWILYQIFSLSYLISLNPDCDPKRQLFTQIYYQTSILSIVAVVFYSSQSAFTVQKSYFTCAATIVDIHFTDEEIGLQINSLIGAKSYSSKRARSLEYKSHVALRYTLHNNKHNAKRSLNIIDFSPFLNAILQASDLHRYFSLFGKNSLNLEML